MLQHTLCLLAIGLVCVVAPAASAADPVTSSKPLPVSEWQLESIKLRDGRTIRGLLQAEKDNTLEFIEIVRPQGKPMFAVLHPLARKEVVSQTLLPSKEHEQLRQRFEQFRHRAIIETTRMQDLVLVEQTREDQFVRVYHGPWFSLISTADDETTRRCIVRIEQTFRAYRLLLPPNVNERRNLQVKLFGSMDEYRSYLRGQRLEIANPAYYSVTLNMIVAGSDLSQYAAELAKVRAQNARTQAELVSLDKDLGNRLQQLSNEMKQKGFSRDEINGEMQARRAAWASEQQAIEKRITEMSRRNDARFAQVTEEMFRRLSHEAFHAYVENYVYPHDRGEMPRWLNEGLAMIFEGGQLEADALRVDAPRADLLQRLQDDLASKRPIPLARLMQTDARSFVTAHERDASDRNYLYAWGIAYYLTFNNDLLRSNRLDEYVASSANDATVRFEKLVGEPLPKFEEKWRSAMLKLKPPK